MAIPQIGTGFGGLKWPKVKALFEEYLNNLNIEVEVYLNYKRRKRRH